MAVDRLSITVPSERGAALRSLAAGRHQSVPTVVTEAIAHRVRMAALDVALAEAGRKLGPVPAELVAAAGAQLVARAKPRRRSPGTVA